MEKDSHGESSGEDFDRTFEKSGNCDAAQNLSTDDKKYSFQFHHVMFGELFGKCTDPVKVTSERMYFNICCFIKRNKVDMMEKYTFSLCANDIDVLHVYFGRPPTFVAIETSQKFANVVCKRIGSEVLCSESRDTRKRYILLTGNETIENNISNDIRHCDLIMSVSRWARVNLLSYREAFEMISDIVDSFPNKMMRNEKKLFKRIRALLPSNSTSHLENCTSPTAFTFKCHKVKFGKLFGKSVAPVRVANNRMYFTINCVVKRRHKKSLEKYTFSVGSSDITDICVYIGHMPSFLIVKTTPKFAGVVCKRIGKNVLCPTSADHKKRYIFLLLNQCYNETYQRAKATEGCFQHYVSPWTRLTVLSTDEALQLLRDLL